MKLVNDLKINEAYNEFAMTREFHTCDNKYSFLKGVEFMHSSMEITIIKIAGELTRIKLHELFPPETMFKSKKAGLGEIKEKFDDIFNYYISLIYETINK